MPLPVGTRLGSYQIIAPLGAGGMGEVYRARDSKLNREVALKVLPSALANDLDYMARFEREAQVLASLNHPNIAAIYGIEESGGVRALVMELVEGPTLAQRIAAGAIPLEESLVIARQMAEALEAAHDKGVVHRDLKPANVKVTPDDTVKVLDFGLAKAVAGESPSLGGDVSQSPTMTIAMTRAGMILGTAAYMSPEQAKGKTVDRRADIWAFGVVLIEMLSGRRAYKGETALEILASVVKDPAPLSDIPAGTPAAIRRLLGRCLDKDPKRRLRDIGEARIAIEEALTGGGAAEAPPLPPNVTRTTRLPWISTAVVATVAIVAGVGWWRAARPVLQPLLRFDIDFGMGPGAGRPVGPRAVISPDGTRVVFPGKESANRPPLFTRLLDQAESSPLIGTEGADFPFFSPDGQWLGFVADGKLKKISLRGGAPRTLCDAPNPRGASWGDGFIAAALDIRGGIARVPEEGGAPQPLTPLMNKEVTHRFPFVLPGGKTLLFVADSRGGGYEEADIVVQSIDAGKRNVLYHGGYFPRYVSSRGSLGKGFLLFVSQGVLFAAPMDADRLVLTGSPVPVLNGVAATPTSGGAQLDVSQNGILLYQRGGNEGETTMHWLDASGHTTPLPAKPAVHYFSTLSPDSKKIAVVTQERTRSLWIYDWGRDAMSRMMFERPGGKDLDTGFPVWTPDGGHLVYSSGDEILWIRSDGAGEAQILIKQSSGPGSFSPDGKLLAAELRSIKGGIQIIPIQGSETDHPVAGKPESWLPGNAGERHPKFSPDGRWLAHSSNESGQPEVYVRNYPGPGGKWQISSGGGQYPIWSPKAHELFYRNPDRRIVVVSYRVDGDAFVPEKPRVWSDRQISDVLQPSPNFDITPDGKRFLVLIHPASSEEDRGSTKLTVLLNFTDELRRRLTAGK